MPRRAHEIGYLASDLEVEAERWETVQADAGRLAVKDEAKAGSWLHNEWASRLKDSEAELAAIEARISALFAEAKALLKAKL